MSSINTNTSAMNALTTLRSVNQNLATTQERISTGQKVNSAKDNAAYFSISETMKSDSAMYGAIDEGLTLTKNSLATATLGATSFKEVAEKFVERVSFAQSAVGGFEKVGQELNELVKQMETAILQSTFNGDDMVNAKEVADAKAPAGTPLTESAIDDATGVLTAASATASTTTRDVVTGVSRASGSFTATTMELKQVDMTAMLKDFMGIAKDFATNAGKTTGAAFLAGALVSAEGVLSAATDAVTTLGLGEKSIENQQEFLKKVTDTFDTGVGAMVDADMEAEAARLQALQVQQQLATQSLSIANQGPQNLLSLFQ